MWPSIPRQSISRVIDSMSIVYPNLNLTAWAALEDKFNHQQLSANWQSLDNHNHTEGGKGLQIPTGGVQNEAITTAKLGPKAVIASKIENEAIETPHVKNNSITTPKLANENVTPEKLSSAVATVPAGTLLPYAGSSSPDAELWLLCDGSEVSRSTYSKLFGVLGTTYGGGNGTTTFNIPDMRGRVAMGADNMGTTRGAAGRVTSNSARGQGAGEQTHTLSNTEMPTHKHTLSDPGHAHGVSDPGHAHGVSDPSHSHTTPFTDALNSGGEGPGYANVQEYAGPSPVPIWSGTVPINASTTGIGIDGATTGVGVNSATTGISMENTGSGGAHNNLQPYLTHNYIIKT